MCFVVDNLSTKTMLSIVLYLWATLLVASGGDPVVNCPAPRSPEHGQAFLYQDGRVVKFVCEPGHTLTGRETVRCEGGQWEEPAPTCVPTDASLSFEPQPPPDVAPTPARPLFDWGSEEENGTTEETPQADEARVRVLFYPRRRAQLVTARRGRLHSATELDEEEQKRKKGGKSSSSTVVELQGPPSTLLVRRTVGKDEQSFRTAAVHVTDDEDRVRVVEVPLGETQSDKGEDALYRSYLWAHHYMPRQASSVVEYRALAPLAPLALSESQIAWINSLHPELRDQYLRDLHVLRADEAVEGARAQAFLRRYDLLHPYYYRQPVYTSDITDVYDYSCNQAGSPFLRAPKLPDAHIARYDRRQNPNHPHNHYLSAVYRCNPGHVMLDTRFTEMHCSRGSWIGTRPICVPRPA